MPQSIFLDFLAAEAARYPHYHQVLGADVTELIKDEQGIVRGVRYRAQDGRHEVRALLTVGADGRFSRVRHLLGFEPVAASAPIDVLWFRLPRRPGDAHGGLGVIHGGAILVNLDRGDEWQIAYVIPKGTYKELHAAGLPALRARIAAAQPEYADRVDTLQNWRQLSLLSVESSRVPRWFAPGVLLIGDAAHVMSPIAGVGINYAIQDAIATANLLSEPIQRGRITMRELAAVQQRREWPTRAIQGIQNFIQENLLKQILTEQRPFSPPPILGLPLLRDLIGRLLAYGVRPERLRG